mmetsp:Transcript_3800/g.10114  ORF Transcript_3800/g.10114 Transcript_3800/m.10114 type:complete len:210 (+) Transcript_3800:508-1137(+)
MPPPESFGYGCACVCSPTKGSCSGTVDASSVMLQCWLCFVRALMFCSDDSHVHAAMELLYFWKISSCSPSMPCCCASVMSSSMRSSNDPRMYAQHTDGAVSRWYARAISLAVPAFMACMCRTRAMDWRMRWVRPADWDGMYFSRPRIVLVSPSSLLLTPLLVAAAVFVVSLYDRMVWTMSIFVCLMSSYVRNMSKSISGWYSCLEGIGR